VKSAWLPQRSGCNTHSTIAPDRLSGIADYWQLAPTVNDCLPFPLRNIPRIAWKLHSNGQVIIRRTLVLVVTVRRLVTSAQSLNNCPSVPVELALLQAERVCLAMSGVEPSSCEVYCSAQIAPHLPLRLKFELLENFIIEVSRHLQSACLLSSACACAPL
jgi:hypothetical protein